MKLKSKESKRRIAFMITKSLKDELKSQALKYSMPFDKFIESALVKKAENFFEEKNERQKYLSFSKYLIKN